MTQYGKKGVGMIHFYLNKDTQQTKNKLFPGFLAVKRWMVKLSNRFLDANILFKDLEFL